MKRLLLILGFVFLSPCVYGEDFQNIQLEIREYDGIEIPAGTFIPVMNLQEVSTQYCSDGYKVSFVSSTDLFMHDTKIIPKDTLFHGYVEAVHAPVVGTNASMKIRIAKMVYSDGFEVPVKGYLYTSNNNVFGGGISEPLKYVKMSHRQQRMKYITMQIKPSMERKQGVHTVINTGSNEIIVLTAPVYITHTLTN